MGGDDGGLKILRFIGSKEGRVTENEYGTLVEQRGLTADRKQGVSYGESSVSEFVADIINAYVYNYNRSSQKEFKIVWYNL